MIDEFLAPSAPFGLDAVNCAPLLLLMLGMLLVGMFQPRSFINKT